MVGIDDSQEKKEAAKDDGKCKTITRSPSSVYQGAGMGNYDRMEAQEVAMLSKGISQSFVAISGVATPNPNIVAGTFSYTSYLKKGHPDESYALLETDSGYTLSYAKFGTLTNTKGTFQNVPILTKHYEFDKSGKPLKYQENDEKKCTKEILESPGSRDMETFSIGIREFKSAYNNAAELEGRKKLK